MSTKEVFDIKIKTVQMQPPIQSAENETKRQSLIKNEIVENLISHETFLRRTAYKNTTIKTDNSFFDDTDMTSEYYLVVVYEQNSNIPLLSSRYYFNKFVITKYLKGDNNSEADLIYLGEKFNLDNYKEGNIFLADRLSGNVKSSIYRQCRNRIFMLFYSEMVNTNKNCKLLLMVRKEKHDKQLSKYLKIGFVLIGSTLHKGKEHSIILGDFKTSPIQC
jgi:hypothetical protein